jgi:hypothetical protein
MTNLLGVNLARIAALSLAVSLPSRYASANEVKVTFLSDPTRATLYEEVGGSQKTWGYTPVILKYQVPRKWNACMALKPLKVRWASGAQASITLSVCPQTGKNQQFVFQRPTGVPGADIDAQFAIAMLQNPARAAAEAPAPVYIPPIYIPPAPRHCTSTVIGNQVSDFTICGTPARRCYSPRA